MAKGKRAGTRTKRRFRPKVLLLAGAVTLSVIAWGYLVWAAIDFGSDARSGESRAWAYLALAAVGAMACLFVALLLAARILQALATPPATASLPHDAVNHRHRSG